MIAVAACEAGLALALILMLFHRRGLLDIVRWQDLREEGQPAYVDQEVPEEADDEPVWPHLTPAGREQPAPIEEVIHRTHV
jgi:NADH-quinone oxidoreductase subunit K